MTFQEILTVVVLGIIFIILFVLWIDKRSLIKLQRRYKEEDDLSKHGEQERRAGRGISGSPQGGEPSSEGLAQFKPGELLPPTTSSTVGGNQSGTEQPSKVDKLLSKLKGR